MNFTRTYIVSILLLIVNSTSAQVMNRYHIDIYNGLPSNHVYSTLVDRHGYLWICTDKGVVRYNGYEFKKFGLAEGLPNEDVWQMIEDKKGRIWLFSISDEMGYVYNNEYKKVVIDKAVPFMRPGEVKFHKNGIYFISPYSHTGSSNLSHAQGVFIEINDTIYPYDIYRYLNSGRGFITEYQQIGCIKEDTIYELGFIQGVLQPIVKCKISDNNYSEAQMLVESNFPFLNNLISYSVKKGYIKKINLDNCNHEIIQLKKVLNRDANIYMIWPYKHNICFVTESLLCMLDSNLNLIKTFDINKLIDSGTEAKTTNVSYFSQDNLWGLCLATSKTGVYINNVKSKQFESFSLYNLSNYKLVGSVQGNSYWWNTNENVLVKITDNSSVIRIHNSNMPDIRNIVPYNKEKCLVISKTPGANYWLNNNEQLKDVLSSRTHFTDIGLYGERQEFAPIKNYFPYRNWRDVIIDSPNTYYAVIGTYGVCRYKITGDTVTVKNIDYDIYHHIIYDSTTQFFLTYNENKIIFFDRRLNKYIISKEVLRSNGITKIESIIINQKYRNILIKDYNKLIAYSYHTNIRRQLFANYNLSNANMFLYNDVIMVLGKFGILFSKIEGTDKISEAIVYPNNKNQYYNFINDFSVSDNKILLKTDRGSYLVNIPSDQEFRKSSVLSTPYKILTLYNNILSELKNGDTLKLDQHNTKLQLDVINPNGNGTLQYSYSLVGDNWQHLNGNEIHLPSLRPDKYYTLSLYAYDDAWRSDNKNLYLYIIPYWWQTVWGRNIIWLSVIIALVLLGGIVAFITRRIVSKNNEKKSLQLGLELNAIYSQINPHFIFNTLNTAQFFIKKKKTDEAFIHINKFSRLLRAYIKSSRNKFIAINEEVGNLKNYIELQQERFENRFDYQIVVDKNEDINQVKIPSLLLQPIVENAINHGLFHKEDKGFLKIEIIFGKNKNEIICVIDDDGIGRKRSKLLNENNLVKRESYGDQLIKDLINVFNKYEQMDIKIEYLDKEEPLTGTIVKLTIKNFNNDKQH